MSKKNLVDVEHLKIIVADIFNVFQNHGLTQGEIIFVIEELKKLAKKMEENINQKFEEDYEETRGKK